MNIKKNEKYLVKSCFNSCPLETLILLNTYWKTIHSIEDISDKSCQEVNAIKISNCMETLAESKGFKKLINFPTYALPVSLKKMYFTGMGFDSNEIKHLILSEESYQFKSINSEGKELYYTHSNYLPIMSQRLSILREDGTKMGLLTPTDYFKAMKNWRGLVTCIGDKAKEHNCSLVGQIKGEKSKHNAATAAMIGDALQKLLKTNDKSSMKNILTYLQDYFGSKESQRELARDFFEQPQYARFKINSYQNSKNIKNLQTYQICQTLKWLENQGFDKRQIRKALPLLFYHPAILEQKLIEIKEMEEFQPWSIQPEANYGKSTEDNRILEVLLYLVEKEFSFSDEGTYFAQESKAISLNHYFSESFCNEIVKHTGVKLVPQRPKTKNKEESDSLLPDTNEEMQELKLSVMNFEDFIYLYDPSDIRSSKKPSKDSDMLISSSMTPSSSSAFLKSNGQMETAYRQFSTLSKNKCMLSHKNAMNLSTETPKKKRPFLMQLLPYLVNPFNWIDMKMQYFGLRNTLDPKFDEDVFIRGCKQVNSLS